MRPVRVPLPLRYPPITTSWVPESLINAFEESKKLSYKRMENPRIVPLAWFRSFVEEQEEIFGSDPWIYGLGESNRKNLETANSGSNQAQQASMAYRAEKDAQLAKIHAR